MYVLIDKANLLMLHCHSSFEVLCNLALIECPEQAYDIFPVDHTTAGLTYFTNMELKKLYTNCTGKEAGTDARLQLMELCWQHAHKLPEADVFPFELEKQAALVPPDSTLQYRYVKGSTRPAQVTDLEKYLDEQVKRCQQHSEAPAPSESPKLRTAAAEQQPTNAPSPAPTQPRQASAAPAPAQRAAKPRGGNKALIWETADSMWKDAGEPPDKPSVLSLRKQIMDKLELEGLKRTSVSSELGNWHKTRAPF